jgi:hypothetical protein
MLALFCLALTIGAAITLTVMRWRRKHRAARELFGDGEFSSPLSLSSATLVQRPSTWLAIRSRNVHAVQTALNLHNAQPCTWAEGLAGEQRLFIAPPVNGWILIVGSDLPDPADDVDACFRFLGNLSRKLGHVQFFSANRVLGHHAWIQFASGRVVRAYAWAGRTLWNQGAKTRAELDLGVRCFQYFESPDRTSSFGQSDVVILNTEKVPSLAARWSIDPADIDERAFEHAFGIAGEPSRLY